MSHEKKKSDKLTDEVVMDEAKWSLRPPDDIRELMGLALLVPGTDRSKLIWHCLRIALPELAKMGKLVPYYAYMRKTVQASDVDGKMAKLGHWQSDPPKARSELTP